MAGRLATLHYRRLGENAHLDWTAPYIKRQLHAPGIVDSAPVLASLASRIRLAIRRNAGPALVLQALAVAVVAGYYTWPPAHALLERLMALKLAWGVFYSFAAGALFGGLLPRLVLLATGAHEGAVASELAFALVFWGYRSVEVDLFYRLQAWWFGNTARWPVVLAKAAVDQFLYSPCWAVPGLALAYAWKDAGYSWTVLRQHLDREFFVLRLPAAIVANAMVWLPTVIAIYFLPAALQLPVSNLVASFWVLLMIVVLRRGRKTHDAA